MKYKDGLRKIQEMNVAGGPGGMFGYGGAGGDMGTHGGAVGNSDFYAPGDARVPKILGLGDYGKKGKKGKKKTKTPIYRRKFVEMLTTESNQEDYVLNCMLYTEVSDYQQVITDLLEKFKVPYTSEDNCVMMEGTDDYIQNILSHIQDVITIEPFENGDVMALIGEMDETNNEDRPEGPYQSSWTSGNFYLVRTLVKNDIVWSFVLNGQQPSEGVLFPSRRDARSYINDNGFVLKDRIKHESKIIDQDIEDMAVKSSQLNGKASGKTLEDFYNKYDSKKYYDIENFKEEYDKKIKQGIKVEMEHTSDPKVAKKITMDHLWEDLEYYDKLAKIEKKA